MTFSSEVLARSPLFYLKFEDSSYGSAAADASGAGRNFDVYGSPSTAATVMPTGTSSINLPSTTYYVNKPAASWMNSSTWTFLAWVKLTNVTSYHGIAARDGTGGGDRGWAFYVTDGKLNLLDGSSNHLGTATVATGTAYMVGVTVSGTTVKLYLNGSLDATFTLAAPPPASTTNYFQIGYSNAGTFSINFPLTGTMNHAAYFGTTLSDTDMATLYSAGTGTTPSTTGTVQATASAPTVSIAGTVTAGTVTGTVQATASTPTLSVSGSVAVPVTGTVQATASHPTLQVVDLQGQTLSGGFSFGSALTSQAITLAAQTLSGGFGFGSSLASEVVFLQRMSGGFSFGSRLIQTRDWGVDPRTGRPEFRVVIADRFGNRYTELGEATISPLACGVNVLDSWSFRIARSDPRAAQVQPVAREAQLWRGNVLLSKGPIGPGRPEGEFVTYDVSDPRWYMWGGRRVIGRIPRLNLLYNGDFTEGLAGWTPTYDAGSAPEAPPLVEVIDDPYTDGGKALQITGQDKVQMTKNVVETSAVFVPNSASYLPGGEAAIQAVGTSITDGSTVHVVGHTANDGTGSGLTLSLNRAKAARATLLAQDPTLTFTLLPGLRSPNANDGSVAGRGYYEPISSSLAPNRRVEIFYDTTQTATGHRQYVRQYVNVSQPVEERMPLEVVFSGDMRIVEWIGAPKDGWAVKLILTKVGAPTVEVDEGNAQMEQADLLDEWASYSASVTVPADGLDYRIEVRLYPPAGTSVWTNCRLEPQEQLGFFGVDQALIVKALIEHAQDTSYGHGALGIGTRTPLTGVSRRKKYPLSEHMPIETAVEWFTSIAKGLDVDFDHLNNAVVTYYPKQGSTSDMALVHGGRASIVKTYKPLTSGVRDLASSVIVQGGGFTGSRPERYASDPAALGGTLLEAVITAEEETPLNELDEAATTALASMLRARPGWEVTLDPARTSDVLDRLHKGDTCRLVLPDEGVDGLYRMVLSSLDPEADILTLTLIEEG